MTASSFLQTRRTWFRPWTAAPAICFGSTGASCRKSKAAITTTCSTGRAVRGTADGAVLYTDSTLALDADTGKIVWHHQFLPRDNWNLDHVFEQILVDINVGNRPRQALLAIGKPGIIWALDCAARSMSASLRKRPTSKIGSRESRRPRLPR